MTQTVTGKELAFATMDMQARVSIGPQKMVSVAVFSMGIWLMSEENGSCCG